MRNPEVALTEIAKGILKYKGEEIILSLSGGPRMMILETLITTNSLGMDAEVEAELEDSSTVISFPLKLLSSIKLNDKEISY